MNNLNILLKFLLLFALTTATVFAENQHDSNNEVEINTLKLGHGLYMLSSGMAGNIGIFVGDDGVFMVDDELVNVTEKVKAAIAKITNKPVKFMINTHWHYDHVGGNEQFANDNAVIVAHENVRKRMSKEGFIAAFNKKVPASPKVALPVITFNHSIQFHFNNMDINVEHIKKAHTDGDSIVIFKAANVIHMGDTFFNKMYPFIDASSEGSINGMIKAADYVLSIADDNTKIIPGHGPIADKKSLTEYRHMLVSVKQRMQKLMDEGKSMEQIIAAKPNADFDEKWGKGFLNPEAFLTILNSAMP